MLLAACATIEADHDGSTEAPLVGVDGSRDQADRNCHIVLRDMGRNFTGIGFETVGGSWVWQGTIEISDAAAGEGLVPRVVYQSGSDPTWRSATATKLDVAGTPGYQRYTVRIFEGLPGPGMSGSALANTQIQVVPFLGLAQGGRLFDHNRLPGDFDNYTITSPDFAIASAPSVCTAPAGPTRAKLVFAADFSERREGVLAPGGELTIAYDTNRLTTCRNSQAGLPRWDITAHVVFSPGGERRDVSVRDGAPTIAVSPTAQSVTLWFENTSVSGCQAWDSNLGANYTFDVARPPQWIGELVNRLSRDTSDPCNGAPASQGFAFDTFVRQRAAITNLCFQVYQPGLTDRDDPDLWQKLDVSLHWRVAGEPAFHTTPVNFDRRVGNNARYAFSWRQVDPFRAFHCPEVAPQPTPDGQYVQLPVEYFVVVNGGEARPEPGAAFAGTFTDYASDPFRDQNCP
ncbi:MAG TPA: DUF6209 family protein [Kofleriaceae bacterium]|nr:DUF6209 family protein [Kofleriaceae bacterium]